MELKLQDLAYFLTAPAGALSRDGSTMRLVAEKDGELYEKEWTGTEVQSQFFIASDVKTSTPAVYLLNDTVSCIAFVDESGHLQCCKYDEEEEEWVQLEELGPFLVHEDSHLSGFFTCADRISIFFQEASGKLQEVSISLDENADLVQCTPVTVAELSSPAIHSAFTSTGMVRNLLLIEQGEIRNLVFDAANGNWKLLRWLPLHGYDVTRVLVTNTDDAVPLQVVALCKNNELVRLNETGLPQEFGIIEQGRFFPGTSKECGAEMAAAAAKIVKAASGGTKDEEKRKKEKRKEEEKKKKKGAKKP